MKAILVVAVLALAFTTGFTCSKHSPESAQTAPAQEQMAAPPAEAGSAPAEETAPAEGQPAGEQ